jgi:hypothetical protein
VHQTETPCRDIGLAFLEDARRVLAAGRGEIIPLQRFEAFEPVLVEEPTSAIQTSVPTSIGSLATWKAESLKMNPYASMIRPMTA